MNDAVPNERASVLARPKSNGVESCRELSAATDRWLAGIFDSAIAATSTVKSEVALVALGGYGRGELAPRSDIDVVLLHRKTVDAAALAEEIWYPIWDYGLKLGHSVRTVADTLSLASNDLITATSILSARVIAGDESLAKELLEGAHSQWSKSNKRYLADLYEKLRQRGSEHGELAFLLEPDIKESRGGLRDIHAMGWAETTEPWIPEVDLAGLNDAYEKLNDVRVALHRITDRPSNKLLLELQDEVAAQLGYSDADALMADVAAAGRSVLWTSNGVFNRIHRSLRGRRLRAGKPREVAPGVILEDRRVHLDRRNHATLDPLAPLRVAVAAATHQAFIERETLTRLAEETPTLSNPWPDEARGLLSDLLLTGKAAIPVWEALDQVGLIVKLIPEWEPCRSRPQRNAYHRFTVDRHLVEAASEAAALADRVDRPDLLVLGALLHDIGKGYPGDHTEVGVELVASIAPRMGFDEDETTALVDMVRHHLLLPDVATRRDLDDDGTLRHVANEVETVELLELLHCLTEADSIATGPAAWGSWKAELVATLVERTSHLLLGGQPDEVVDSSFPTAEHLLLIEQGRQHIAAVGNTLTVVAADRPGLFAQVAGVLALNGVDILEASVHSETGIGLEVFRVAYEHGNSVPWPEVIADLETALSGGLAIAARLAERASVYRVNRPRTAKPISPSVTIDNSISGVATVIEVSCPDGIGVLYRIVRSFLQFDMDVVGAKVQTLMHDGVDTFYVRTTSGDKITDPAVLSEIERAVLYSLAS
ncbi:MAG: [protein-PII] uridylyltransferase [Acidimicrobiales bacterium]